MRGLQKLSTVTVVVLLLSATVAGTGVLTGLATAQSDTYSHQFTNADSVRFVGFETEGWGSGTFTVEVSTNDGPGGGSVVLYRKNHTTAGIPDGGDPSVSMFENAGAYSNITITVTGAPDEPTFGSGGDYAYQTWDNDERLGSTGGDRDLVCDTMESLSTSLNPAVNIVDCGALPGSTSVNETSLTDLDANETKLEIYQSAAASSDSAENVHAIMNNYLQDAETVALIKGENSYIKSLNSEGSKTTAKSQATQNISEYYSVHERNLISQWNSQIETMEYLRSLSQSETGISKSYVRIGFREGPDGYGSNFDESASSVNITGFGTTQFTLQNGTSVDISTVQVEMDLVNDAGTYNTVTRTIVPGTTGYGANGFNADEEVVTTPITVGSPNANLDEINVTEPREYNSSLTSIDTQTTNAQNQMDTVVEQTYDQYQSGEINNSELVDPYVLQNQYNPGSEFEGWAAATLAGLGTNQPTNLSQTGYMNVTLADGTELQGVLHSQANPPSGEFEVGKTYNPENITGTQYVVTDSEVRELQQNFTLDSVTNASGGNVSTVTIEEKNYETTSTADLSALYDELATLRASINARQQALRSYGGGGGLFAGIGGSFGLGLSDAQAGAVVVAALLAGLLLLAKASD